jgi:hypothetical protein
MCGEDIILTTREKTYDPTPSKTTNGTTSNGEAIDNPFASVTPPSTGPLHIEVPNFDSVLRPPKGTIQKLTFNPNACAAQT